ncbi:MAG: DNA recombination protein RmuC, partial [Alistipes sp.]|nr:DNA recombination protein RmuC [Alistipes sp.]
NVVTKKGSTERVEFAVKLPNQDDSYIYLPIDSKLPLEAYHKIQDAQNNSDVELLKTARTELKNQIKKYASDISTKYIDVPNTTEFAIMFLPIEGLYMEVLELGLFEELGEELVSRDIEVALLVSAWNDIPEDILCANSHTL